MVPVLTSAQKKALFFSFFLNKKSLKGTTKSTNISTRDARRFKNTEVKQGTIPYALIRYSSDTLYLTCIGDIVFVFCFFTGLYCKIRLNSSLHVYFTGYDPCWFTVMDNFFLNATTSNWRSDFFAIKCTANPCVCFYSRIEKYSQLLHIMFQQCILL